MNKTLKKALATNSDSFHELPIEKVGMESHMDKSQLSTHELNPAAAQPSNTFCPCDFCF